MILGLASGFAPSRWFQSLVDNAVRALTQPLRYDSPAEVTNLRVLVKRLREGDVLLISGTARISRVVKLLTMSPWSHVVLYVGDRRDLLSAEEVEEWEAKFGRSSLKHLVIDADPVRGVHLRPVHEHVGLMVRHCRPAALSDADRKRVVEIALSQLGREYDVGHIINLLLFFAFPWELLPTRLRQIVTEFTLSEDDRICSRVLSEAFHSVGYPIRPLEVIRKRRAFGSRVQGMIAGFRDRRRTAARLMRGGRVKSALTRLTDKRYTEIHLRGARHITPADYDLSRFFSIIKDDQDLKIDYRRATALCPVVFENERVRRRNA